MTSLRLPTVVSAILLAFCLAVAAPAAASAASSDGVLVVRVEYQGESLDPNTQVRISLWKLDEDSGLYRAVDDVAWSTLGSSWSSSELAPGSYSVRFLADDESVGLEYWDEARYFYDSADVRIDAGQRTDLGTVTLDDRTFDVGRVAGLNRFATAVAASALVVPDGVRAPVVYLADGMNPPDALAAGPAAIAHGGVLLLTGSTSLPEETRAELRRLNPERLVIVGGPGAVSKAVEAQVRTLLRQTSVERLGGATRYETGRAVVRDTFRESEVVLIATGRNYPDALAAGPAAGYLGAPVVLVDGAAASIDSATSALIADLGATHAILVGGPGAVSAGIENSLRRELGDGAVTRVGGDTRFETAAELGSVVFDATDFAFLASGLNFPDALGGAPLAGAFGAPVFLTMPSCMVDAAAWGIWRQRANAVLLIGGPGALSAKVEQLELCA